MENVEFPSNRGSFISESYRGQKDHSEYMSYLQGEHGEVEWVKTSAIMQNWVDKPIVSEGFSSCYPLIAIKQNKGQMIHMSRDPWSLTNTEHYWQKLREWGDMGSDVALIKTGQSALGGNEVNEMKKLFGSNLLFLDLDVNSRFGLVVDVKSRLLLLQLTDLEELRKYRI